MKSKISNIVLSGILFGFVFCMSCSQKKQDTHTHEEGSMCEDHVITEQPMPEQESFKVEADSNTVSVNSAEHDHGHVDGHDHNQTN
jgi:hypothetical protein